MGLPGTMNFVGEFLTMQGIFSYSFFITFLSGLGVILGSIYSIWMYNRVFYGKIATLSST
jgi:NADH-quinone oxidoreductase subunit M